jgi:hypothetical protein
MRDDVANVAAESKGEQTMKTKDYTTSLTVDQSPDEVFDSIANVRGWWSEEIDGSTDKLGAEFKFHYKDFHCSTQKITELVPDKKAVWHVSEAQLNFVKNKTEWNGTDVVFEITKKGDKTELRFTHVGLVPAIECYGDCSGAISNHRLVSFADGQVTFRWRDSAHHNEQKLTTLSYDKFLRRFLLHLLPQGFMRIRHFGFLACRRRPTTLPLCFQLLGAAQEALTEEHPSPTEDAPDLYRCPKCGGPMKVIERLTAAEIQLRSPPRISCAA